MRTVSIKSDGLRTQVFNSDGTEISNTISSVSMRADARGVTAEIELAFISVDSVDVQARMIGPAGKEVRRIEYADGSVEEFGE